MGARFGTAQNYSPTPQKASNHQAELPSWQDLQPAERSGKRSPSTQVATEESALTRLSRVATTCGYRRDQCTEDNLRESCHRFWSTDSNQRMQQLQCYLQDCANWQTREIFSRSVRSDLDGDMPKCISGNPHGVCARRRRAVPLWNPKHNDLLPVKVPLTNYDPDVSWPPQTSLKVMYLGVLIFGHGFLSRTQSMEIVVHFMRRYLQFDHPPLDDIPRVEDLVLFSCPEFEASVFGVFPEIVLTQQAQAGLVADKHAESQKLRMNRAWSTEFDAHRERAGFNVAKDTPASHIAHPEFWSKATVMRDFILNTAPHRIRRCTMDGPRSTFGLQDEAFVIDLSFMEHCEVREGLGVYGGSIFMTADYLPTRIRREGRDFGCDPCSEHWQKVSFAFRNSLLMNTFVFEHAGYIHLTYANGLAIANYSCLDKTHPVRELTTPFHFGTIAINAKAVTVLTCEGGLVHRTFGMTASGLREASTFAATDEVWSYLPFDQWLDRSSAHPAFKRRGKKFFTVTRNFVREFFVEHRQPQLDLHWAEVGSWWDSWRTNGLGLDLPPLTKESLFDFIATAIAMITAVHWLVGANYADYYMIPLAYAPRWKDGFSVATLQASLEGTLLGASTSKQTIDLMSDWWTVYSDEAVQRLARKFQQQLLLEYEKDEQIVPPHVQKLPAPPGRLVRPDEAICFDPRLLEVSVAK